MDKIANSDSKLRVVTPREHEIFDKLMIPIIKDEVTWSLNGLFSTGIGPMLVRRAEWLDEDQDYYFKGSYLVLPLKAITNKLADDIVEAIKARIVRVHAHGFPTTVSNANLVNQFNATQYFHSRSKHDEWNGYSRNDYMLEPVRELIDTNDGVWTKYAHTGRLMRASDMVRDGKVEKTMTYTRPIDPAEKHLALFNVTVKSRRENLEPYLRKKFSAL